MFGSKGDKKAKASSPPADTIEVFSRPVLQPGYYGQFPATFSIFFAGPSRDKKTDYYILGTPENAGVSPHNAITIHKGMVKHQITLHVGPNHSSAALGLAGATKLFRSGSVIALPAATTSPNGPVNQIEDLSCRTSIKFENFAFSITVGPPGGGPNSRKEEFEWRTENLLKPPPGKPFERTLVRMPNQAGAGEEIVGRWTGEQKPEQNAKLGEFQFEGTGATGELGPYWALMVVMSLLRVSQIRWEASAAADSMITAAGKLVVFGVGVGVSG